MTEIWILLAIYLSGFIGALTIGFLADPPEGRDNFLCLLYACWIWPAITLILLLSLVLGYIRDLARKFRAKTQKVLENLDDTEGGY